MNKRHWSLMGAFLLLTSLPAAAEVTFIKAGAVVDPARAKITRDVVIRIDGGKVREVGSDIDVPADAIVIDLSDQYVLPGLFDCHTHLCSMIPVPGDIIDAFTVYTVDETLADRVLQSVPNARDMLDAGFTTVRDVGNCGDWGDIAVRNAIGKGKYEGPTVLVSGKIIAPYGGQYYLNYEMIELAKTDYIFADTHDEMVKGVRENLHYGADWIKIVVDAQKYTYTEEDVRVIVDEAGRAGVNVCAHVMSDKGARSAILGGVKSLEHGFPLSSDVLEMMKENDVWLVGTDFSRELFDVYGYPAMYDMVVDRLRRAYKIGVRMAFGADIVVEVPGHDRGSANLTFLDTWLDAGVPDADILRAMTSDAAELLEMEKSRGAIAKDMAADIIAVPRNPLEDILVLREVSFVMKAGNVYKSLTE